MNRHYAQIILFLFLFATGLFQLIRGIERLRMPRENKIVNSIRIILGIFLGAILPSILLLHFFNPFAQL